jgi:hypothetical protein
MTATIINFPGIKQRQSAQVAAAPHVGLTDAGTLNDETVLLDIDLSGPRYGLNGYFGYRAAVERVAIAMSIGNPDPPIPA